MSRKSKALEFIDQGYNITVTGRHVLVTEPMKQYAMEKIAKIERFSTRIIDVTVTMDVQKLEHRVDIVLKVDNIKIKSHASSTDMYASIDLAVDRIVEQLRKYKGKIQNHQAKNVNAIDMRVNVLSRPMDADLIEVNDEIEDENSRQLADTFVPHKVISQETRPLKTLNIDEAVMKMELSGDEFLIFRGEEDRKLKVIYRRKDGNYAVIEVES